MEEVEKFLRSSIDEFALEVNKPEDLTEPLRSVYTEALQDGLCKLAIYAPTLTSVQSPQVLPPPAYLLMMFDGRIFVAAYSRKGKVVTTRVPLADVLCVELGQVLLFCWIKVVFGKDVSRQIKIPFNLVGLDLFSKALNLMRETLDSKCGNETVEPLKAHDLDFKFKNVLHDLMQREELLLGIAFQPEVRTRLFLFLERQVMPPLLAAITNRQFVLVTEERPASVERLGRFSEIYTYCPHERIESLRIENDDEPFHKLVLTLKNESARFVIKGAFNADSLPAFKEVCDLRRIFWRGKMNQFVSDSHGETNGDNQIN